MVRVIAWAGLALFCAFGSVYIWGMYNGWDMVYGQQYGPSDPEPLPTYIIDTPQESNCLDAACSNHHAKYLKEETWHHSSQVKSLQTTKSLK